MVICSIYTTIILYISDNTHLLLIPPMNTIHTTIKNLWYIICLNRRILTYRSFFYYVRVFFNRWYMVALRTVKSLLHTVKKFRY